MSKTKTARSTTRATTTFRDRIVGLVWVPPARLKKHPENWRTHPERQREAFGAILAEVGIADAALAFIADDTARADMLALPGRDERAAWLATYKGKFTLIDGHLRREMIAAQSIPTLVLDVSPDEARKALASHDAVTALAEAHAGRWRALVDAAPFDGSTVRAALESSLSRYAVALPPLPAAPATTPPPEDEEEPVIPTDALIEKWGTAPGQLWVVPSLTVPGREHRLLCSDCRDPANVDRLHEGARPDLGLHDPPYGIAIVSKTGSTLGDGPPIAQRAAGNGERARTEWTRRGKFAPIEGDAGDFDAAPLLGTAERVVLWGANNFPGSLPPSNDWIVWDKKATSEGSIGDNSFSDFELAFVSPQPGKTGHTRMIRHLWSGLIRASEKGEQRLHPTQKPIAVQRQIVEWHTNPGDLVADWYMGAGAVIIACEQTGRIGHGMDIAHAYLAATLERLSVRGLTPRRVE